MAQKKSMSKGMAFTLKKVGFGLLLAQGLAFSGSAYSAQEANGSLFGGYGVSGTGMNSCTDGSTPNFTGDLVQYTDYISNVVWQPGSIENGGSRVFVGVDADSATPNGAFIFSGSDAYDRFTDLEVPLRPINRVAVSQDVWSIYIEKDGSVWRVAQNATFDANGRSIASKLPKKINTESALNLDKAKRLWVVNKAPKPTLATAEQRAFAYLTTDGNLYMTQNGLADPENLRSVQYDSGVIDAVVTAGSRFVFYRKADGVYSFNVLSLTIKKENDLTMEDVRSGHVFSNKGEFIYQKNGLIKTWTPSGTNVEFEPSSFIGTHGGEIFYNKNGVIKNYCAGVERETTRQNGSEKPRWIRPVLIGSSFDSYTTTSTTAKYYRVLYIANSSTGLGQQVVKSDGGSIVNIDNATAVATTNNYRGQTDVCGDTTYCEWRSFLYDRLNFYSLSYGGSGKASEITGKTGNAGIRSEYRKSGVFVRGDGTLSSIRQKGAIAPVQGIVQEALEGIALGTGGYTQVGSILYKQGTRFILADRDVNFTRLDEGKSSFKSRDLNLKQGNVQGDFYLDHQSFTVVGLDGLGRFYLSGVLEPSSAAGEFFNVSNGYNHVTFKEFLLPVLDQTKRKLNANTGQYADRVALNWSVMPSAVSYNIYRKAHGESQFTRIASNYTETGFTDDSAVAKSSTFSKPSTYYVEGVYENTVLPQNQPFVVAKTEEQLGFVNLAPTKVGKVTLIDNTANPVEFNVDVADPDQGDTFQVSAIDQPRLGSVVFAGTKAIYTPNAGAYGVDSFKVVARDSGNRPIEGTVTVLLRHAEEKPLDASNGAHHNKIFLEFDDMVGSFGTNPGKQWRVVKYDGGAGQNVISEGSSFDSFTDTRSDVRQNNLRKKAKYLVEFWANTPETGSVMLAKTSVDEGWVSSAPVVQDISGEIFMNNSTGVIQIVSSDDDGDQLTHAVSRAPFNGQAVINSDELIYTPNQGFSGVDSFEISTSDATGNIVKKVVGMKVFCTNPTVNSVASVKDTFSYKFNSEAIEVVTGSIACQNQMAMTMTIEDSQRNVLANNTQSQSVAAGNNSTKFFVRDLEPGTYKAKISLAGSSVKDVQVAETQFEVIPMELPALVLSEKTINEDTELTVQVLASKTSCGVVTKEVDAINEKACLVEFSKTPAGLRVQKTKEPLALGNLGAGADQIIQASVYVFDSSSTKRLIGVLEDRVSVIAGKPVILKTPEFEKQIREVSEFIEIPQILEPNGYQCQLFTDKSAAEIYVSGTPGSKACFIKFDKIPFGMKPQADKAMISGRILKGDDNEVSYTAYKYFIDGHMTPSVSHSFRIPVSKRPVAGRVYTEKDAYAAGLQDIRAELLVDSGTLSSTQTPCRFTLDEADARQSYKKGNEQIACVAKFDAAPAGMNFEERARNSTLVGRIAQSGDYPINYTITAYDEAGVPYILNKGSHTLKVRDVNKPVISFEANPKVKRVLDKATGEVIYVVPSDGSMGVVKVVSADLSTVKVATFQGTTDGSAPLSAETSRMKSGDTYEVRIRQLQPAWTKQVIMARAVYEGLPPEKATTELPITIVFPPPGNMVTDFHEIQPNYLSTTPFALKAKVGEYQSGGAIAYDPRFSGKWKAYLAEPDGSSFISMSEPAEVDNQGFVTFSNLEPRRFTDKSVYVFAYPVEYEDTGILLKSRPSQLTFVNGNPVLGRLKSTKSTGVTPISNSISLEIDRADFNNLGTISWQLSRDDGVTWETVESGNKTRYSNTFVKGGRFTMRAEITNKHSQVKSFTDTVVMNYREGMKPTIVGFKSVLPGETVKLGSTALFSDGQPAQEFDVIWEINDFKSPVKQIRGQRNIEIASEESGAVNVVLKVKPKYAPDEETAYSVVAQDIKFLFPNKLRAAVQAPKFTEAGNEVVFSSVVKSNLGDEDETSMKIVKVWTAPDGTEMEGDEFKWVAPDFELTEADTAQGKPFRKHNFKFSTWVQGVKESTLFEVPVEVVVNKYVFPKFELRQRMRYSTAPASGSLQVVPASRADVANTRGKKLKFEWVSPDGATSFARGSVNNVYVERAGEYPFKVIVSDDRGNSQTLDVAMRVEEPDPKNLEIQAILAQKVNRAPVTFRLKSRITGGHPRDLPTGWRLLVDGEVVTESKNGKMPQYVTLTEPGTYMLSMEMYTTFSPDKPIIKVFDIKAGENDAPDCELIKQFDKSGNVLYLAANCVDRDGRLAKLQFFADGVPLKTSTNKATIDMRNKSSVNIEVIATDDSGAETVLTEVITK